MTALVCCRWVWNIWEESFANAGAVVGVGHAETFMHAWWVRCRVGLGGRDVLEQFQQCHLLTVAVIIGDVIEGLVVLSRVRHDSASESAILETFDDFTANQ